ncbi:hypothetical protein OsI_12700 [Oryza sativa Indica Group]|jgi:hypothetical protein|uniref:Uncharacterized protein n=2 Tax=Oryza TaxID=4527 RepID=A0A0E0GQR5_ORYNI|nr:hypothetical protein OsI_12700 [Oryza sativa Indica Group]
MGFLLRVVQLAIVIAAALVIVITSSGSHYRDSVGVTDHGASMAARRDQSLRHLLVPGEHGGAARRLLLAAPPAAKTTTTTSDHHRNKLNVVVRGATPSKGSNDPNNRN